MATDKMPELGIANNPLDNAASLATKMYNRASSWAAADGFAPNSKMHVFRLDDCNKVDLMKFRCFKCNLIQPSKLFMTLKFLRLAARKAYFVLDGKCKSCVTALRARLRDEPLLTPLAKRTLNRLSRSANQSAESRGLACILRLDDVFDLWVAQDARCALSGRRMVCQQTPLRDWNAPSIDRIDSGWNYTIDNIHLVCWAVNSMKSSMSVHEFRRWCAAVTANRAKEEAALLAAMT